MAGRVFQVIDSSHELELMENTRPPVLDASRWYMRRRTARTWRPAIPATRKRMKDWLCGLVSTSNCEDVPKLVVGRVASTHVSASGMNLSVSVPVSGT